MWCGGWEKLTVHVAISLPTNRLCGSAPSDAASPSCGVFCVCAFVLSGVK